MGHFYKNLETTNWTKKDSVQRELHKLQENQPYTGNLAEIEQGYSADRAHR